MSITTRTNLRSVLIAAALDVASVLLFVTVGRRNHNEGTAIDGVITVATPFLIALGIGWLVTKAWRRPMSLRIGAIVWMTTVVVGLLLRNLVFDRGTAAAFVIVATLFLGAVLLGWRVIFRRFGRSATRVPTR